MGKTTVRGRLSDTSALGSSGARTRSPRGPGSAAQPALSITDGTGAGEEETAVRGQEGTAECPATASRRWPGAVGSGLTRGPEERDAPFSRKMTVWPDPERDLQRGIRI